MISSAVRRSMPSGPCRWRSPFRFFVNTADTGIIRMSAIRRLGMLGKGREDVQNHLADLLSDKYLLVQLAVVRALGTFADERVTEALMKYTRGDLDGRLKRAAEEAIRKVRKGMEQEFPLKKNGG